MQSFKTQNNAFNFSFLTTCRIRLMLIRQTCKQIFEAKEIKTVEYIRIVAEIEELQHEVKFDLNILRRKGTS